MRFGTTQIARIAHEINRAYCQALGDDSQKPWEEAPEIIRRSVVSGVEAHLAESNGLPPGASHQRWLDYKIAEGWVYGEKKDIELKTHPDLVPFDELPVDQQAKDFIFGAVVALLR